MAIVQEHFDLNGVDFVRTYSDGGFMIHGGSPDADYSEACDPAEFGRTYTETNVTVEWGETETTEILSILLGGTS